ncbi:MAG TPA: hypothetical protein VNK82_09290 [Terriglobales bacterium]|nr:hypothetical protein [Terriglobales bacterium]
MALPAGATSEWVPLGPEGGDVRTLAYDPSNPDRILLGTSAGQLFVSNNGGTSWERSARLGSSDTLVLDHIVFDPSRPSVIYVSGWDIEKNGGDTYRSRDGGRTWQALPGLHGKSVRALAVAPSDPRILVAGALDGVFRSPDGGDTWQRISPEFHAEIRNIESIAIDPRSPDIVYAGTWHLPWKTTDGGRSWARIDRGVIDDSDVFSIIIDRENPAVVYASACSGIYKSQNGGEQFRKIQGIPASARRTRVLRQDPQRRQVVYAGTTEGLWRTEDGGSRWMRLTAPNYIINDVLVDPRDSNRVLLATDRAGVVVSQDGGRTFRASNRGFSHRRVETLALDPFRSDTLYAGVLNDKEFGGVFVSRNSGQQWTQLSDGLGGSDVFALRVGDDGTVVAGTNRGVFAHDRKLGRWKPINVVEESPAAPARRGRKAPAPRTSSLKSRVADLALTPQGWYAATSVGLLVSQNHGRSWRRLQSVAPLEYVAVRASGDQVIAASRKAVMVSRDGGSTWLAARLPSFVSTVYGVELDDRGGLWLATREGAFLSRDGGRSFSRVLGGLPDQNIRVFLWDAHRGRLLAASGATHGVFESRDGGTTWNRLAQTSWPLRSLASRPDRLFAVTVFDGVVAVPQPEVASRAAAGGASE